MVRSIVVPLEGSELAERALPQAEEPSRLTGAPIHLVRVVDDTVLMRYGAFGLAIEYAAIEPALAEERAAAREYLDRAGGRSTRGVGYDEAP